MEERNNLNIPVYVSRSIDMVLDINAYPFNEKNRQLFYAEIIKRLNFNDIANINQLALSDIKTSNDNAYSYALSEAFDYCEENDLFVQVTDDDDCNELPLECYAEEFFEDINSNWPIYK